MTSFLRTRKDRHPRSESKHHLQQEHVQSGDMPRGEHNSDNNDRISRISDTPYQHGNGNTRDKPR